MANVRVDFKFQLELDQKEFSVMTRTLAGHTLTDEDTVVARQLNVRLLEMRVKVLSQYSQQSSRALSVAREEAKGPTEC